MAPTTFNAPKTLAGAILQAIGVTGCGLFLLAGMGWIIATRRLFLEQRHALWIVALLACNGVVFMATGIVMVIRSRSARTPASKPDATGARRLAGVGKLWRAR